MSPGARVSSQHVGNPAHTVCACPLVSNQLEAEAVGSDPAATAKRRPKDLPREEKPRKSLDLPLRPAQRPDWDAAGFPRTGSEPRTRTRGSSGWSGPDGRTSSVGTERLGVPQELAGPVGLGPASRFGAVWAGGGARL